MLLVRSGACLSVPLAFRGLIDHGFVAGSQMQGHFLLLFGIAVAWGCASAGRFFQVSWIGERITADLRRSEEHTSELQSLMRISYAVFCLKKKKTQINTTNLILRTIDTKDTTHTS